MQKTSYTNQVLNMYQVHNATVATDCCISKPRGRPGSKVSGEIARHPIIPIKFFSPTQTMLTVHKYVQYIAIYLKLAACSNTAKVYTTLVRLL